MIVVKASRTADGFEKFQAHDDSAIVIGSVRSIEKKGDWFRSLTPRSRRRRDNRSCPIPISFAIALNDRPDRYAVSAS